MIRLLIDNGADIDAVNINNNSALIMATNYGKPLKRFQCNGISIEN